MNGEAQALSVAATVLVIVLAAVAIGFVVSVLWALWKKWFGALFVALTPLTLFAPQSPRGMEAYGGGASVTLTWQPMRVRVDGFRVYYRKFKENYVRFQDAGTNLSLKVIGLDRKTTYWFTCRAYRDGEESDPSNEVFYRTPLSPSYR